MNRAVLALVVFLFMGCSKQSGPNSGNDDQNPNLPLYKTYTIQAGAHYSDQQEVKSVTGTTMDFTVKFNSSAIYPSIITDYDHSYDVNKLWGFSEGQNNHVNSARLGWRYLNGQLQLLAYTYVSGTLYRSSDSNDPPVIASVGIDSEIHCSITVSGNKYIFSVNGSTVETPRGPTSPKFTGYQQYPYFGGTLTAPHLVTIQIK